ncbi:MAG: FAD-dependent thymidylate synthase [Armatimonadetes bacterium]|nr:FAD-dependent thymidylate synthase [Armatimonadota bacterium]
MKVTHASVRPTLAAQEAGRPALTPELLAAVAARYSRSDDGLDAILAKVDQSDPDKSIDTIFAHVDYGHASIADNVPVAMFMDGLSVFLVYYMWSECSLASGQESSTRYIKMSREGVVPFELTGLAEEHRESWNTFIDDCFRYYDRAYAMWNNIAEEWPQVMRIPDSLLSDQSDKAQKQVARMRRNYAFDRARYFLPVSALTNVVMLQSAREWARLANLLNSSTLPEFNQLGALLVQEMSLVCPRMVRHAQATAATKAFLEHETVVDRVFRPSLVGANKLPAYGMGACEKASCHSLDPSAHIELFRVDPDLDASSFQMASVNRKNRYSIHGSSIRRTAVRFSWDAVAMAEIRDLNRHRTGQKWCPLSPQGFYCALDQLDPAWSYDTQFEALEDFGWDCAVRTAQSMWAGENGYQHWSMLGTQYYFEHTTMLDKFIYEGELRTGTGAHYRYAKHLRDALSELYREAPQLRHLVMEGSAEPE